MSTVVTGMTRPTATTCSTHRWSHCGRRRGHTSKSAKAAVADRPRMMVRRKSEDGELFQLVSIRRPTPIDIVTDQTSAHDPLSYLPEGIDVADWHDYAERKPEEFTDRARASMAKVIIGGQMLSLLLALLVTPVTYSLFDGMGAWLARVRGRLRPAQPDDDQELRKCYTV